MDKIVTAAQAPMPTVPSVPLGDAAGWYLSGAFGLVATLMWLRRRVSRDNAEIVKDRAEGTLLQIALQERDKAMEDARKAWAQRTTDAEKIAGLRAENEYLKGEVSRLRDSFARVDNHLAQVLQAVRAVNPQFELVPITTTGETHGT